MKFTSACGTLLCAAGLSAAAKCNADDCARAVTGTLRAATASRFADCQSFLASTVTPAAATVTSTVTADGGIAVTTIVAPAYPENFKKRLVSTSVTALPSGVPVYASACSGVSRYSSACSCYGATTSTITLATQTSTVTVTVTPAPAVSTVSVQPAAPTLCGNAGLQWAYFDDSAPTFSDEQVQSWDPAQHKVDTPVATGVTNFLHFWSTWTSPDSDPLYGVTGLRKSYFAIEHRGYLFAPESGVYNFTASLSDDNVYLWLGPQAYSGWTKENAQQSTSYSHAQGRAVGGLYQQSLTAGNYYPFRIVFRNGLGPGNLDYNVTAPSGYMLIGNNIATAKQTPYVVQYSCDGMTAPVYPPFGQET